MTREVFVHLAQGLVELLLLRGARRAELLARVEISGLEHIAAASRATPSGGVLVVTAHLGNWELACAKVAALGFPVSVVYRGLRHSGPRPRALRTAGSGGQRAGRCPGRADQARARGAAGRARPRGGAQRARAARPERGARRGRVRPVLRAGGVYAVRAGGPRGAPGPSDRAGLHPPRGGRPARTASRSSRPSPSSRAPRRTRRSCAATSNG